MTRLSLGGIARLVSRSIPRIRRKIVYGAAISDLTGSARGSVVYLLAARGDVPRALAISGETDEEVAQAAKRHDAGDQLVYARMEERIAFYGWITIGAMEAGSRLVPTDPSVAYAYKLFSSPEFRGLGLARGFYGTLRAQLTPAIARVIACVAPGNAASVRLHEAAGFRAVGDTRTFGVGNWSWGTVSESALEYSRPVSDLESRRHS